MKAKRFLTVDGDFFCHRAIHGMRIVNPDITLDTSNEMNNYNKFLINSIHSLYDVFVNEHHNLIDQIIFVFDDKSWRKSIKPYNPYFNDNNLPIGYKENRVEMKDKSSLNYNNLHLCKNIFIETLEKANIFPIFKVTEAEGDDSLILLKEKLLIENIDNKIIVFCTDGDLKQLLYNNDNIPSKSDSIMLYRNIRSADAPEGEFVISENLYTDLYGKRDEFGKEDIMDAFIRSSLENSSNFDSNYFKNILFKINFKDKSGKATYDRTPGNGISIATPTLTLLSKIITGDKKDNIFPLFRWKTKTGNSIRNVSENQLIKVFKELDFKFNDTEAQKIYNDKLSLTKILYSLRDITNQNNIDIQIIGKHFAHNRNLLDIRTSKNLPEKIKNNFNSKFNNYLINGLLETTLTKSLMSKLQEDYSDSTNILSNSLPDLPDELKIFSDLV